MKIITNHATILNTEGRIDAQGVTVIDNGDTISIADKEYPKFELEISDDRITSKVADPSWEVILK
jgi:hypothetical protein